MLKEEFEFDDDTRIIKHRHKSNFTIICNTCINDETMPADALGALVYIMSKPDDWKIIMKNISNRFSIGRDKTYNIINKLIESGYMKRVAARNEDGSLSKTSLFASDTPIFLSSNPIDKQPLPEKPEVVTEEKADKQPLPEKPDTVNQEVVPYIQIKDSYKENNNNKDYGNDIDARATPPSDELANIYPEDSVVVFFMKKIEGSGVPKETMASWLRKHGEKYVAEKVRIYQAKGAMTNPGGFLSSAIRYDWKEKTALQPTITEASKPSVKADINDAKNWFRYLADNEKLAHYEKSIKIWGHLENALKMKNASVLDEDFVNGPWFKPMMDTLGVKF